MIGSDGEEGRAGESVGVGTAGESSVGDKGRGGDGGGSGRGGVERVPVGVDALFEARSAQFERTMKSIYGWTESTLGAAGGVATCRRASSSSSCAAGRGGASASRCRIVCRRSGCTGVSSGATTQDASDDRTRYEEGREDTEGDVERFAALLLRRKSTT